MYDNRSPATFQQGDVETGGVGRAVVEAAGPADEVEVGAGAGTVAEVSAAVEVAAPELLVGSPGGGVQAVVGLDSPVRVEVSPAGGVG